MDIRTCSSLSFRSASALAFCSIQRRRIASFWSFLSAFFSNNSRLTAVWHSVNIMDTIWIAINKPVLVLHTFYFFHRSEGLFVVFAFFEGFRLRLSVFLVPAAFCFRRMWTSRDPGAGVSFPLSPVLHFLF